MPTTHQMDLLKTRLHAMRARLDARVSTLREEASHGAGGEQAGGLSNTPIHLADLGSSEAESTVSVGLAMNEAALRQEIDDALARLDQGTFGICEECRQKIPVERLHAVPYARRCVPCATRNP